MPEQSREQVISGLQGAAEVNLRISQARAQKQARAIAAIVAHLEAGTVPDASEARRKEIPATITTLWDEFATAYKAALMGEREKAKRARREAEKRAQTVTIPVQGEIKTSVRPGTGITYQVRIETSPQPDSPTTIIVRDERE